MNIKQQLLNRCFEYVEERIRSSESAIKSAKEAAQDDTKSSAGDKYETTREMMQQEVSRNEAQLFESRKLKHVLSQITIDNTSETVQNGSIAITDKGNFFLSVSAGQFTVDNRVYFAISSVSPIGKLLSGLRKDDRFQFNGKDYTVLDVQ